MKKKLIRGFAGMDKETKFRVQSMGGKAAHAQGKGHEFTHEEAVAAGRKGALAKLNSK